MGETATVLEFDDLVAPRLTDVQRQILDHTESRVVDLDMDRMLAEAVEQAGVDDLDEADGVLARVGAYVAAIEADDGLTQLIRGTLRSRVVRLLRNRLSLTGFIKRYPEVEAIEIDRPIIVVGMPRSGTTHLVNLWPPTPGDAHCRIGRAASRCRCPGRAPTPSASIPATPRPRASTRR